MRKIKFLFPLMILLALAASAFTRQSSQKTSKKMVIQAYYVNSDWFCQSVQISDENCSPDLLGPNCELFRLDVGWTTMFENGTSTICWQPLYSLYPNNP